MAYTFVYCSTFMCKGRRYVMMQNRYDATICYQRADLPISRRRTKTKLGIKGQVVYYELDEAQSVFH